MTKTHASAAADFAAVPDEELMLLLACGFIEGPVAELLARHARKLENFVIAQAPQHARNLREITIRSWETLLSYDALRAPPRPFTDLLFDAARKQCSEYRAADDASHYGRSGTHDTVMDYAAILEQARTSHRHKLLNEIASGRQPAEVIGHSLSSASTRWLRRQPPANFNRGMRHAAFSVSGHAIISQPS